MPTDKTASASVSVSASTQPSDEWKDALLDKLAITCQDAPIGTPPADILNQIISWHVMVAKDPAVNEEAAKQHDAVATLTEEGWIWDGDQWQRSTQPSGAQEVQEASPLCPDCGEDHGDKGASDAIR